MTHQYTKLADDLDATATFLDAGRGYDAKPIREAARILRAADAVDVQGFMALYIKAAGARAQWLRDGYNRSDAAEAEGALESALRLALAAREG